MKKTFVILILIFVTQFFSFTLNAQEQIPQQTQAKEKYHNLYTINVFRFVLNDARFGIERPINERFTLRAVLGLKYNFGADSYINSPIWLIQPYYFTVSKGFCVGGGINYFFSEKKRFYVSTELYYDYYNFDDKLYKHGSGQDAETYSHLTSMQLYKTGVKILFGAKLKAISNDRMDLIFDVFAGVGLRYRKIEITTTAGIGQELTDDVSDLYKYDSPRFETEEYFIPTIHLGVLMGFSFKGN